MGNHPVNEDLVGFGSRISRSALSIGDLSKSAVDIKCQSVSVRLTMQGPVAKSLLHHLSFTRAAQTVPSGSDVDVS